MKLLKQTALMIIVIVLFLSIGPSKANLISLKSEDNDKKLITSCFTPPSQKNFANFISDPDLVKSAGSSIEFLATGNDFYVGLFQTSGNNNFLFNIVYGGWNNSQTQIFKNGDYGSAICVYNGVRVDDPTVQTKYKFVYSAFSGKLSGYANDHLKFECKLGAVNPDSTKYWGFSSWTGGVKICPLPTIAMYNPNEKNVVQTCFNPQAQKVFTNYLKDSNLASTIGSHVEFLATGNDFYVGIFDTSSNPNFLYNIVFGGWNNSQTQIFKNGDYSKAICIFNGVKVDNTSVQTKYKFVFLPSKGKLLGFANDAEKFSCDIGQYNAGTANFWAFSSWTGGVKICPPPVPVTLPHTHTTPAHQTPVHFTPAHKTPSANTPYGRQKPKNKIRDRLTAKCDFPVLAKLKTFLKDEKLRRASKIEFLNKGTNFHVGIFNRKNGNKFLFNIVYGGCKNGNTKIYKNGDLKKPVCEFNGVKVKNLNKKIKYAFIFDAKKGKIVGYANGKEKFVCDKLGKFDRKEAKYWGLSSFKGHINIVALGEKAPIVKDLKPRKYLIKKCFDTAKSQKFKHFFKDNDLKTRCGSKIEFLGKGNDFYVAVFDKENTNKFLYAIVYGGWNNSQTKVFKDNLSNPICSYKLKVENVNVQIKYNFDFNPSTGLITGFANGKKVISCKGLANYKAGTALHWGFSSYNGGVTICPPNSQKICKRSRD
jgi:hypothetical protein